MVPPSEGGAVTEPSQTNRDDELRSCSEPHPAQSQRRGAPRRGLSLSGRSRHSSVATVSENISQIDTMASHGENISDYNKQQYKTLLYAKMKIPRNNCNGNGGKYSRYRIVLHASE